MALADEVKVVLHKLAHIVGANADHDIHQAIDAIGQQDDEEKTAEPTGEAEPAKEDGNAQE